MVRTVMLSGKRVSYTVRRRKGYGKISVSVRPWGVCVVTGRSVPIAAIEAFLVLKRAWLLDALAKVPQVDVRDAREQYATHKETARVVVLHELERLNAYYGFTYGRVSIRNSTSRWGSCSSKKNLNFSYRILFLPPDLREYLVVHELCHLQEMHHGPAFWALVAERVPDYAVRRNALRMHALV